MRYKISIVLLLSPNIRQFRNPKFWEVLQSRCCVFRPPGLWHRCAAETLDYPSRPYSPIQWWDRIARTVGCPGNCHLKDEKKIIGEFFCQKSVFYPRIAEGLRGEKFLDLSLETPAPELELLMENFQIQNMPPLYRTFTLDLRSQKYSSCQFWIIGTSFREHCREHILYQKTSRFVNSGKKCGRILPGLLLVQNNHYCQSLFKSPTI